MRLFTAVALCLVAGAGSSQAANSIEIRKASPQSKTIDIRFESTLSAVAAALAIHVGTPVDYLVSDRVLLRYGRRNVTPLMALREIVQKNGYVLELRGGRYEIRDPKEATVTLDVQDVDVRATLLQLKKQCGIENLIIDREVQGKGTFLFRDVPCSSAFRTVFNTFALAGEAQSNSVMLVGVRK